MYFNCSVVSASIRLHTYFPLFVGMYIVHLSTSERVTTVTNLHFPNGMLGANLHGSGNRVLSVN